MHTSHSGLRLHDRAPIPGEAGPGESFRDLSYPMPTTLLDLGGIEVACSQAGQGDPAILLIHGLGSYMPVWSRNLPALSRGHRVVAIDLPGYGKSSKQDYPYSMDFFAGVVDRVIDALDLRRVVLCGHSMGGQIALTHALRRPGKAAALCLIAPAGMERFTADEARWLTAAVTREAVMATPPEMVHANLAANFSSLPAEAGFMIKDRLRVIGGPDFADYAHAVACSVRAMLEGPVYDRLPEIAVPALVVFGTDDRLIPNPSLHRGPTAAVAEAGAARIPGARLCMVEEAGHMVHFERPPETDRAILDFLAALPPPVLRAPAPMPTR